MKVRVNFWLTIFLFLMMLLAGVASSYVGYFMGREALKVVTQPDINSEDTSSQKPLGGKHKGLKIIKEKDILTKVYNLTHSKNK
ncbi:hypothetical protein, partial [Pleurocapsa sp. PCC 7319]|uniref:hypothetical protein n=1 Tax=Pleurocapsa sp. PCC 7319 TaxID=118161 RepID=UPI0003462023